MQNLELDAAMLQKSIKDELLLCIFNISIILFQ